MCLGLLIYLFYFFFNLLFQFWSSNFQTSNNLVISNNFETFFSLEITISGLLHHIVKPRYHHFLIDIQSFKSFIIIFFGAILIQKKGVALVEQIPKENWSYSMCFDVEHNSTKVNWCINSTVNFNSFEVHLFNLVCIIYSETLKNHHKLRFQIWKNSL